MIKWTFRLYFTLLLWGTAVLRSLLIGCNRGPYSETLTYVLLPGLESLTSVRR
jgi:hypothetical protein